jgi:RNA polymerase sigma-70 factor (ECF subfamily)
VPAELASSLHELLRRHFSDDLSVEVVVERRGAERRSGERRADDAGSSRAVTGERRRVRNRPGRRVGERRATVLALGPLSLPRRAQRYAGRIVFVERLAASSQHLEDLDTARLVTRLQSGERELFSPLYLRYFDRVYNYLRLILNDAHEAEDATQQVFIKVLEALPGYERRGQPFRAWLFRIARNHAIGVLRRTRRVDLVEPRELESFAEPERQLAPELRALSWVSDGELLMLIERLPLAQRQVLLMRYLADLSVDDVAAVLGRTPTAVRKLQARSLAFLRERLVALGRKDVARPMGWQRRVPHARVLRRRRFALLA